MVCLMFGSPDVFTVPGRGVQLTFSKSLDLLCKLKYTMCLKTNLCDFWLQAHAVTALPLE